MPSSNQTLLNQKIIRPANFGRDYPLFQQQEKSFGFAPKHANRNLWLISLFNEHCTGSHFLAEMVQIARYSGTILVADTLHVYNLLALLDGVYQIENEAKREQSLRLFLQQACHFSAEDEVMEQEIVNLLQWRGAYLAADIYGDENGKFELAFELLSQHERLSELAEWLKTKAIHLGDQWLDRNLHSMLLTIWSLNPHLISKESWDQKEVAAKVSFINQCYQNGEISFHIMRWDEWVRQTQTVTGYQDKHETFVAYLAQGAHRSRVKPSATDSQKALSTGEQLFIAAQQDAASGGHRMVELAKQILPEPSNGASLEPDDEALAMRLSQYPCAEAMHIGVFAQLTGYVCLVYPGAQPALVAMVNQVFSDSDQKQDYEQPWWVELKWAGGNSKSTVMKLFNKAFDSQNNCNNQLFRNNEDVEVILRAIVTGHSDEPYVAEVAPIYQPISDIVDQWVATIKDSGVPAADGTVVVDPALQPYVQHSFITQVNHQFEIAANHFEDAWNVIEPLMMTRFTSFQERIQCIKTMVTNILDASFIAGNHTENAWVFTELLLLKVIHFTAEQVCFWREQKELLDLMGESKESGMESSAIAKEIIKTGVIDFIQRRCVHFTFDKNLYLSLSAIILFIESYWKFLLKAIEQDSHITLDKSVANDLGWIAGIFLAGHNSRHHAQVSNDRTAIRNTPLFFPPVIHQQGDRHIPLLSQVCKVVDDFVSELCSITFKNGAGTTFFSVYKNSIPRLSLMISSRQSNTPTNSLASRVIERNALAGSVASLARNFREKAENLFLKDNRRSVTNISPVPSDSSSSDGDATTSPVLSAAVPPIVVEEQQPSAFSL